MARNCANCGKVVHGFNLTMVMLHDWLWEWLVKDPKIVLCADCISLGLGIPINQSHLKYKSDGGKILCNEEYVKANNIPY